MEINPFLEYTFENVLLIGKAISVYGILLCLDIQINFLWLKKSTNMERNIFLQWEKVKLVNQFIFLTFYK